MKLLWIHGAKPLLVDKKTPKPELVEEIKELKVHDHICLFYETKEKQFCSVIPFIKIGLERNTPTEGMK